MPPGGGRQQLFQYVILSNGKGGFGMTKKIDARGRSCPEPVMMVQREYDEADTLSILAGSPSAVENITRYCEHRGGTVTVTQQGDVYTMTVTKPCCNCSE